MVLETFTAQHKGVDNRLLAALESLIRRIVRNVVSLSQTTAQITEDIIDIPGSVSPMATLDKSKPRKYTDERAKIGDRCGKYAEAGMELGHVAV